MARKVIFNINNTLVATINKINQMSDWLGDLDDLNKRNYQAPKRSYLGGFADNEYVENGGPADQSAVAAAEWLHQELTKARVAMFGPEIRDSNDSAQIITGGVLRFNQVLVADSAVIQRLRVQKLFIPIDSDLDSQSATVLRDRLDSNYYNPPNTGLTIDSGYIARFSGNHLDIGKWLITDSEFRTFYNDSTDSIGSFVPLFNFGFTIRDSGYIGTVHGPRNVFPFPRPRKPGFPNGYTFDSSTIDINGESVGEMSYINLLAPDSTDSSINWTLNYDSANFKRIKVDSALFDNLIHKPIDPGSIFKVNRFIFDVDSSYDTIKDWRPGFPVPNVDSALKATFHGRLDSGFEHTTPFVIYDSLGQIAIGGYMLSQHDSDDRL